MWLLCLSSGATQQAQALVLSQVDRSRFTSGTSGERDPKPALRRDWHTSVQSRVLCTGSGHGAYDNGTLVNLSSRSNFVQTTSSYQPILEKLMYQINKLYRERAAPLIVVPERVRRGSTVQSTVQTLPALTDIVIQTEPY
eukprot:439931-Rhodomonas_salina.2